MPIAGYKVNAQCAVLGIPVFRQREFVMTWQGDKSEEMVLGVSPVWSKLDVYYGP